MHFFRPILTGLAVLSLSAAAGAVPNPAHHLGNAMHPAIINMNMGALNNSGQNGTARIAQDGAKLTVKVAVFKEPKGAAEPAHIHQGTCAKLNPKPWKPLSNVVNGTSMTTLTMNMADLKKGHYAINVHDAKNLAKYVSCGDI